jgi:signal peptidase I
MANYFSLFLVVVSAITGLVWLIYAVFFAPKTSKVETQASQGEAALGDGAVSQLDDAGQPGVHGGYEMPAGVDFCKQMFPIFFGVMIFRSFIYEPFQIPSGSMFPTLLVGDFLLVEKFAYSLKEPVGRNELMKTGDVERGDVVVFKFPDDERVDYIKRVVGLPGDTIIYRGKQIFIRPACADGEVCQSEQVVSLKSLGRSNVEEHGAEMSMFSEQLGDVEHLILRGSRRANAPAMYSVPQGHYFVMGDNRDNSLDSRSWGYVPEQNIVGKAVFVWMSFEFERAKEDFLPTWIPTGIRFERIGGIT